MFIRCQLNSIFSKAASVIVNILSSIKTTAGEAVPIPRTPGQRKDLWNVPMMPLGFQFHARPEQGRRYDLLHCTISTDTPWKIFEGCWHSFHLSCLDVVDVFPICSQGIEDAIRSLSSVANKSIHTQGNSGADCVNGDGSVSVEETSGNDDDDDDELPTSSAEGNVDQLLPRLAQQIMALPIRTPPIQPVCTEGNHTFSSQPQPLQSSSQRKPLHCAICGHLLQGHQRISSNGTLGKSCPVCPSQLCAREGHSVPCVCHWCSQQSQTNVNIAFSSIPQGPFVVQETQISPDITEWLISVSQSSVTPGQMGSNVCTIIAVYGAVKFLLPSTNWTLPSPHSLPVQFVSLFKQLMIYGNQSYNCLGNQQPTYSAPEIINHPQLGFSGVVKCGDEYQFNSFSLFADELVSGGKTKPATS